MIRHLGITWGHVYWPWYLAVTAIGFLTPELYALFTNTDNTLSDYAWHELGVSLSTKPIVHSAAWLLTQGMFIVMAIWLVLHIWYHEYT